MGGYALMYNMATRGAFRRIIVHCLIVLRGDAQETIVRRVHYSQWVRNKKARVDKNAYRFPFKDRRKNKFKTNRPSHSVQPVKHFSSTISQNN